MPEKAVIRWHRLGLIVADIYLLWGWASGKGLVLGKLELQSPEYAALVVLVTGLLLLPLWANRSSVRFGRLADELEDDRFKRFGASRKRYWSERLGALKIDTPPLDALSDEWKEFVSVLYPQARDRRICSARQLWKKLSEPQEG